MTYRIFDGYNMSFQDIESVEFPCMRDTDLLDSKNKIIYESDILERGGKTGVVEWDEWARQFVLRVGGVTRRLDDARDWSIVGDAFQNGDLL